MTGILADFDKWFDEQHGKRPSADPIHVLEYDKNEKNYAASKATALLDLCKLWDYRKMSARYAFNACNRKIKHACD